MRLVGIAEGAYDFGVDVDRMTADLTQSFAGYGKGAFVQMRSQFLHQSGHAASLVEFEHGVLARHDQANKIGHFLADGFKIIHLDVDAHLLCNGRDVQGGVGGAPKGATNAHGIFKVGHRGDFGRPHVLFH